MQKGKMGVGGILLVIVFVGVCLGILGGLALVTAQRDAKLVDQATTRVVRYYEMELKAEHKLAHIDEGLRDIKSTKEIPQKEWTIHYQIQGEEWERLDVNLKARWDETVGGVVYAVESWIFSSDYLR